MANSEVARIRFKGDEYEVHTVKLSRKDIRNLKNGTTVMYFNKEAEQAISLSMEAEND